MPDPLYRRLREHAAKRLPHEPGDERAKVLQDYRTFLRLETEMLERFHRKGDSGLRVAQARSIMMDVLLENAFTYALKIFGQELGAVPCPISVLALGGYGREELCPFSDIDLMFLYPDRVRSPHLGRLQEVVTDTVLYLLWDLGLKVGHCTRTIKEAMAEAKANIETKNSMLEARRITGSKPLFRQFTEAYKNFSRRSGVQDYLRRRLADQVARRARHGDTVYLQEPDIKNGVGGLRDYQSILWMACIKLDVDSVDDLLRHNHLGKTEHRELVTAYDFLLRVRNELHFQSERATDVLSLEKQPVVAWRLGYHQRDLVDRVEAFMRDYYSHARNIDRTAKLLEQRLALRTTRVPFGAVIAARRREKKRSFDGFVLDGDSLSYEHRDIFREDPERLVRAFRHAQQHGAHFDVELASLVASSRNLVTPAVAASPSANRAFLSIIQTVGEVFPALHSMHELGVLERVLPEFAGLTCLVQLEYYHRYTADMHTLNTLRELDRVFANEEEITRPYRLELHETGAPELLYLILLLHDIGKGEGISGHALTGARIAPAVLERMGIPAEQRGQILFIIEYHLEMARFWQRFDIDDPQTARAFGELVGDEERLRYLFVHTFCDARGTAADLWNSYKDGLHRRLFQNTLAHLAGGGTHRRRDKSEMISKEKLRPLVPEVTEEEVEAHLNLLPERYFVLNAESDVALHLSLIHRLLERIAVEQESLGSLQPVVDWKDDLNLGMTVVTVVTWDRAGLFFRIAGAFSVAGVNIMSSRAMTRSDHITIDTFFVADPGGGVVRDAGARDVFLQHLEMALAEGVDLSAAIAEQAEKLEKPSLLAVRPQDQPHTRFVPTVEVYHELSLKRTIIEVHTRDRIGLLAELAKAIYEHGFDITFARIATERGLAVDTFYIDEIERREGGAEGLLPLRAAIETMIGAGATDAQTVADPATGGAPGTGPVEGEGEARAAGGG